MINNNLLIGDNNTVLEALQRLDNNEIKLLYVMKGKIVFGTLTDGDIRRFLISGGSVNATVDKVANTRFKRLESPDRSQADRIMRSGKISSVPVIGKNGELIDIYSLNDVRNLSSDALKDVPVVIQAGGFGTRLYPYTKVLPKPLIPIGETPIIEHIINRFYQFGCRQFYVIINYKKNMIKSYFSDMDHDYSIEFIDEETPLGTGGGLSLLRDKINSTFFLTNCDVLLESDYGEIVKQHRKDCCAITMVCANKVVKIPYGVIETEDGKIVNIEEKPTNKYLINTGVYVVEPFVIENIELNKKIDFPDVFEKYWKGEGGVGTFTVDENDWLDMGELDKLDEMVKALEKD